MENCKRCGSASCTALQRKLQAVDFAMTDTALYLDAYPNSQKALAHYQRLRAERALLVEAIRTQCAPTDLTQNESTTSWDWIKGPWPWQFEAN